MMARTQALGRVSTSILVASVLATAVLATGCSQAGLRKQYDAMRPAMTRGDWKTASAQLEKAKDKVYGEKDRVMYWLNIGAILHYAKDAQPSSDHLVKAEQAMEELWTTSVTAEASKVLVGETIQSYPGEDFEKVLLYYYTAMNNVWMGKMGDAVTEARRADELLKKMAIHFEKEGNGGTDYKQDAFMLWLVGLFYEMEGSFNDAYLAYKASYAAYKSDYAGLFGQPPPTYLAEDLVRSAMLTGFSDDAAKWRTETGATGDTAKNLAEMGEVIVFHGNGESPFKRELRFDNQMADGYVMSIAVPEFVPIPPQVAWAEVNGPGAVSRSETAEPITTIVLHNFKKRLPAIQARAIARAATKYLATKGAQAAAGGQNSGAGLLVGLAANIAAYATEAADLRSWQLLPAEIRIARVWLPVGKHTLNITYHRGNGSLAGQEQPIEVDVVPGKRTLISVRSVL
ncbi:MAG: hypothetical protein HY791_35050 [Deltaproteobacteria bacterium]|nr:hypothetical protein [Deltaproteobacteria bacterium]